jgi:putative transposase
MAYHKNTLSLEKMLLKFLAEPDPMLAMLEWLCHQLMEVGDRKQIKCWKR